MNVRNVQSPRPPFSSPPCWRCRWPLAPRSPPDTALAEARDPGRRHPLPPLRQGRRPAHGAGPRRQDGRGHEARHPRDAGAVEGAPRQGPHDGERDDEGDVEDRGGVLGRDQGRRRPRRRREQATLTVKQEHKDANGTSSDTLTQLFVIDGTTCRMYPVSLQFKQALVLGASSGIGEALALRSRASGARRGAGRPPRGASSPRSRRRRGRPGRSAVHAYVHDVTDVRRGPRRSSSGSCATSAGSTCVVYAAGVMPEIGEGEYSFAKDHAMVDDQPARRHGLDEPRRRALRGGARRHASWASRASPASAGGAGTRRYCTSKAALTTYLEALRNRLSRYGVNVVTVEARLRRHRDDPRQGGALLAGLRRPTPPSAVLSLARRGSSRLRLRPLALVAGGAGRAQPARRSSSGGSTSRWTRVARTCRDAARASRRPRGCSRGSAASLRAACRYAAPRERRRARGRCCAPPPPRASR